MLIETGVQRKDHELVPEFGQKKKPVEMRPILTRRTQLIQHSLTNVLDAIPPKNADLREASTGRADPLERAKRPVKRRGPKNRQRDRKTVNLKGDK